MPKYLVKFNQAFCDALSQHASLCDKTGTPFVSPEQYVYLNTKKNKNGESFAIHHFHPDAPKNHHNKYTMEQCKKLVSNLEELKGFFVEEISFSHQINVKEDPDKWRLFLNEFSKNKDPDKAQEIIQPMTIRSSPHARKQERIRENQKKQSGISNRILPTTHLRCIYENLKGKKGLHCKEEMPKFPKIENLIDSVQNAVEAYTEYENKKDPFNVPLNSSQHKKMNTEGMINPPSPKNYYWRAYYLGQGIDSNKKCTSALQGYIIFSSIDNPLSRPYLQYIDAETSFMRTKTSHYSNGSSAKNSGSGGVDLLLYNTVTQRPVIGEYKSKSDSCLKYAFIQALTYASELLPPHQMERFYSSYVSQSSDDYLPISEEFAHAPSRTSPEVELLLIYDRGAQKQEKTIPTVQKWIKEILAADVGVKAVTIATYDKDKPATDARLEQTHFFSKDEVSTEHKPLSIRPPALQPIV